MGKTIIFLTPTPQLAESVYNAPVHVGAWTASGRRLRHTDSVPCQLRSWQAFLLALRREEHRMAWARRAGARHVHSGHRLSAEHIPPAAL